MATAGYNSQFLVGSLPSVAFTNEATGTTDLITFTISTAARRYLDKSVATVVQKANDEIQTVTITGAPTGGTFTLSYGGNTTSALAYNATAAAVQTALQALASIGAGNALVSGSAGGPYTVRFTSTLGLSNVALMTAVSSLTGGTSPSVVIVEAQAGNTWTTITTGFTLYRANARVVFSVAQPTGTQIRFASGNYIPYTTLGEATSCEFAGKIDMLDATTFNTTGTSTYVPGLFSGTLKTGTYWINNARAASLTARDLIIVSFVAPTGNRYEGYCYASSCSIKVETKGLVTQDLEFQLTDEYFAA